jgi:lysyl-tRNA synthetase class 2
MSWQPSASIAALHERAKFLQAIRKFFEERHVLEVDVPILSKSTVTAPHLASFAFGSRFMQTSPEYAMKRLLAAGIGPIYYLGKAFRKEEAGSRHNPEFTMLEWYRPDWDHYQLIQEVDALLQTILACKPAQVLTYQALFETHFKINPHLVSIEQLQKIALENQWVDKSHLPKMDKDGWLDLLLTHGIEPDLGQSQPMVITDFPASQASLAKIRHVAGPVSFDVAERFEFYYRGFELANGYHELTFAPELLARFEMDLQKRKDLRLSEVPIDHALLDAMAAGLPPCAGVALGVDRLLMLKLEKNNIRDVLPFSWDIA